MSSHHIVRENQEPALFIADPHCLDQEHINQLLEWSPTLITVLEHYQTLMSRGIKVDVLVYPQGQKDLPLEESMLTIPFKEDYWSCIFSFLSSKNNGALNVISPQTNLEELRPWLGGFSINILNSNRKFVILKNFEKWLPMGSLLFIPSSESLNQSRFQNLRSLSSGQFEVIQDGFVCTGQQKDYFLIAQEL